MTRVISSLGRRKMKKKNEKKRVRNKRTARRWRCRRKKGCAPSFAASQRPRSLTRLCLTRQDQYIFLPWTKAAKEKGETIFWAKQNGVIDPQATLSNHLRINNPPSDSHLSSFKHQNTMRPMTRSIFLTRINKIVAKNQLTKLPGHGIRIGSTLEYLLRGVPFDVVKAKGRWQSEAFKSYLRKHAQIMARTCRRTRTRTKRSSDTPCLQSARVSLTEASRLNPGYKLTHASLALLTHG